MSAVKSNMGSEVSVLSRPWVAFYNIYSFSLRRKGEAGVLFGNLIVLFFEHGKKGSLFCCLA